ncbi:MAG: hypothetical protein KDD02_24265 [Phaeodactylibacter sp.]|nr:hypothetical protein [Phaeodactylibacter sp.]
MKKQNAFKIMALLMVGALTLGCQPEEEPEATPAPASGDNPIESIMPDATVTVVANYRIKLRQGVEEGDWWLSPEGGFSDGPSLLAPFRSAGTGSMFTNGDQFRILTAKHIVDATASQLIMGNEQALASVAALLVEKTGWNPEGLTQAQMEQFILGMADNFFEAVPLASPGHFVLPGTSEVTYMDQLKAMPEATPDVAFQYVRSQLGERSDFAVIAPQNTHFSHSAAYRLEGLASYDELEKIAAGADHRDVLAYGFPDQEGLSFKPRPSKGFLVSWDGESLRLSLANSWEGSSGSLIACEGKLIGLVYRFADDKKNLMAEPAYLIKHKLKEAFAR